MKTSWSTTKKWIALALGFAILLTGCVGGTPTPPESQSGFADDAMVEKYGNIFAMTTEQRIADYNYLWDTLRESYLFWGVIERTGTDVEDIYEEYLAFITANENDADFYVALNSMMFRLGGAGHLGLVEPGMYEYIKDAYADTPERFHWHDVLNGETTAANYPAFGEMLRAFSNEEEGGSGGESDKRPANVTAFILPGGEVAYLRINSFDMNVYEEDRQKIFAFYDTIGSCKTLIVDITPNGGGGESYWMDLIVAPHITQPLSNDNYALIAMTDNNRAYLEKGLGDTELLPIAQLPELPELEGEDRARATHYYISNRTAEPSEYTSPFKGKFMLLTSGNVYSSSEALAVFCKDTGFARLVGENTGGDGIGIDPAFVALPNSGILVRYSMIFGLNKDGSSSEELGTAPDYPSPWGESPLTTALRILSAEEK